MVTHRYSRAALFQLKRRSIYPPGDVMTHLKLLGLYHGRGCKAGRNKHRPMPVITTANKQKKAATVKPRNLICVPRL
ncbi:hypothetical protein Pmani_001271 [Petrolisthes manimaculis]|uniref:Uncharacterized protein n=1 Tax=Petrolisthes manimaculis TaxID=1843537 RepID=A0AAE1QKW3_9EUCA|nr:hypothetical protein Pmani_001271 [Petrolisthes manimaculis]